MVQKILLDINKFIIMSSSHNAPRPKGVVVNFCCCFFFEKGVIIGFEEETVQVDESIGMKTLCVNVSLGQLERTTTVSVSSQDQTAISEYTTK